MTIWDEQTRRRFLLLTGAGLGGALVGCTKTNNETSNTGSSSKPKSDGGTAAQANVDAGGMTLNNTDAGSTPQNGTDAGSIPPNDPDGGAIDCERTDDDIEGPFYRPNVPIRNELDLYGDAGTALTLSGQVLDLDCNPIANAVVDIWHADPTTVAAGDLVNSDSVNYDNTSSEMRYRGQTATDGQGRYSFHTKKPGWYLNGNTFRPMHIHVKVWVGNTAKLTTQLYFVGDPHIAGDPWASPDRSVALSSDGPGAEKGTFNFVIS